ncbi:hypothetical protein [Flammeovirga sp. SJP92]|uniref:hypothetical protein n=1 Tax=Flammeovirga sp. SJP92 TaxID=1775430 RepID=UPI0007883DC9|nr:hypothetical protein [Flammeovirga sp. SJP92]KXX67948.1 hypothetical protein AVL50_24125 [Flammeovirga sp. SJP92]
MKKVLVYLLALLLVGSFSSCSSSDEVEDLLSDIGLDNPPSIAVSGVADGVLTASTVSINVTALKKIKSFKVTIPELGEMDFAQAPTAEQLPVYLALGIDYEEVYGAESYAVRIGSALLDNLSAGEHSIPIMVTDMLDQSIDTTVTFTKE